VLVHITLCRQMQYSFESMAACPNPAKYQSDDACEDYACEDHVKDLTGIPSPLILTQVEIKI